MALDLSFDKIAAVYDAQRAHPPEVAAQIGRALVTLVGQAAPILELGVGTGRIAIPTAAAGGMMVGLDVSPEMLAVAAERAEAAGVTLELLRGDAQALPFADGVFRAALAVHVLHLLPDWRAALAEVVRVVGPGGLFIQGSDWRDPDSCVGLLRGRLRIAAVELIPGSRPPGAGAAVAQALARHGGATAEPLVAARWTRQGSPAEVIAGMAARVDSETWVMPEDLLAAAMERVTGWAEATWGDLSLPQAVEHRFLLTATRFTGEMV
ncbi:MAG TPA: class I SAM-dependent methyltransferase [Chloroflexaceae bacterium]|nr:class I SAM-dependent methyltransferase [Chloroflexaceae bacterium]